MRKNYLNTNEEEGYTKKDNKWLGLAILLGVLVLSGFMYYKVEILLTSFIFIGFSWFMLIASFVIFFMRNKIKAYFHKNMYSSREYIVIFNSYLSALDEKERAKDKGAEKPLRDMMLSLKIYPFLIAVFFILELVMNRMGYNWLVAPGAVLFYVAQLYCFFKIIKEILHHWNVYRIFKSGELEL